MAKQISIGDDNSASVERGPDDLVDELRPGRHVQQHLAAAIDRRGGIDRKQQLANPLAKRRAARIAADDDIEAVTAQRFFEQAHLRRFADSVDAVERKKQLISLSFIHRSHVLGALGNHSAKPSWASALRLDHHTQESTS